MIDAEKAFVRAVRTVAEAGKLRPGLKFGPEITSCLGVVDRPLAGRLESTLETGPALPDPSGGAS